MDTQYEVRYLRADGVTAAKRYYVLTAAAAREAFLRTVFGRTADHILEILEVTPVIPVPKHVMYTDPKTGETKTARADIVDGLLPALTNKATHVDALLTSMKLPLNENMRRQLRFAKQYLVLERGVPVASVRSNGEEGGYYIAQKFGALSEDADQYEAAAAGNMRMAAALRELDAKCFPSQQENNATDIHNDHQNG